MTLIVLLCYRHVMEDQGDTGKVDGVWRIVVGLSLLPAFGTLYQRLTLPESIRYKESKEGHHLDDPHTRVVDLEKTADSAEAVNDDNVENDNESEKRDKKSEKDGDSVVRIEERDVPEEDDRTKPVTPVSSTVASIEEPPEEVRSVLSVKDVVLKKKAHFRGNDVHHSSLTACSPIETEFITYFSEWRHAKILIGTCVCWFLLDVAYVSTSSSSLNSL